MKGMCLIWCTIVPVFVYVRRMDALYAVNKQSLILSLLKKY